MLELIPNHLAPTRASRALLALGVLIVATLRTSHAEATSVRQFSLDELLDASALVVRVHVGEGSSYARDMGDQGVCTDVRLDVIDVLKGDWNKQDPIEFCLPGGVTPEGKLEMVVGAPMPAMGDTYIVFLGDGDWHYTPFVNWYYGALREELVGSNNSLVAADGRCVGAFGELGAEVRSKVAQDDQLRHFNKLGVPIQAIDVAPPFAGSLSGEAITAPTEPAAGAAKNPRAIAPTRGPASCADRDALFATLRSAIAGRNSTTSGASSQLKPTIKRDHTPVAIVPAAEPVETK